MKHRPTAGLLAAAAMTLAGAAHAIDCDVNVLQAYQTAKARGWRFACTISHPAAGAGFTAHFVTYPPDGIGCVVKTPPVVNTGSTLPVDMRLFTHDTGLRPALRNGWQLKGFEIAGAQWTLHSGLSGNTRVNVTLMEPNKPAHTYNVRLSRLTLTKSGTAACSQAMDQAF